jgi:hypothetical protein
VRRTLISPRSKHSNATLLNAKSIAYVDPASGGTSGTFLAQALEKLVIAAEIKPKLRLVSPPTGQGRDPV